MSWAGLILTVAYGVLLGGTVMFFIGRKMVWKTYHSGFIDGLDRGTRNHAVWLNERNMTLLPLNGFACQCGKCGNIMAALIMANDEYVRCQKCGHRMPAPLAPLDMEVPHG